VLEDKEGDWKPQKDYYYDHKAASKDKEKEVDKQQQKQRHGYTKRLIDHPCFYNIGYNEVEEKMKNMDQGEVIIRPSSKGEDRLTFTWKVHDTICQNIDVKEENKPNTFSLGQPLWIGNEKFEDPDEIIARHINPMAAHAKEILNFKYCKDTRGRRHAEEILGTNKKAQPEKIHYLLSPSKEWPGKFLLSYLPRIKPTRHEYITITPGGFRLGQTNFKTFSNLMKWFKKQ
jgi:transcription elongation factor SPT6